MRWLYQVHGMHFDLAALSKPSIWGEASRIVNEEGFRAFGDHSSSSPLFFSQLLCI